MTKIRIHARRTARFLGLSRRSLLALAILGASFALGRLALDALLPAAAMASQSPSSVATPALASANPIEGGVAAFDRDFTVTPMFAAAPDAPFDFTTTEPDGSGAKYILIKSDKLPAPPVSVTTEHSSCNEAITCSAKTSAERSQRIIRLTGDFSRAFEQLARGDEKQVIESLRMARRAAHGLRAEHALPTPGTRIFPQTPQRAEPLAASSPAPALENSRVLPAWLVSLAAWVLAGI